MEYDDLVLAIEQLNGQLATIRLRADPSREFLAEIEYCAERDGIGYVYLFWVDRRSLSASAETLTRVAAEAILDVWPSGISGDSLSTG